MSEEGLREDLETTIQRFRGNFVVKFMEPFIENNFTGDYYFDSIKFEVGSIQQKVIKKITILFSLQVLVQDVKSYA